MIYDIKSNRLFKRLLYSLIILTLLSAYAYADEYVNLDDFDIQIVDDNLDTGDELEIRLEFDGPDVDMNNAEFTLEIKIDGTQVHYDEEYKVDFIEGNDTEKIIKSNDFKNEDDEWNLWEGLLMAYDCGSHDVDVSISDGNLDDDWSQDDTYDVGDSAKTFDSVSLSMEQPSLEDDIEITVTDDDGDEYNDDAKIRVVWLSDKGDKESWDKDDSDYETDTKSDGTKEFSLENKFEDDAYGAYRIDIYDDDPEYCLHTIRFNVSNQLIITGPYPENPKTGEAFKINITRPNGNPAIGISVTASGPEPLITGRSGVDGIVSFTFNRQGTYTILAGGGSSGFDEVLKTVVISEKPVLTVDVTPETQDSGKSVEIKVEADGTPIADATINVVRAGGSPEELSDTTSTQGIISYTPSEPGDYTVKATKNGYTDGTGVFKIEDKFKITLPSATDLKKGSEIVVKVTDQDGSPVGSVSVSVEGKTIVGLTDANGLFKFIAIDVGEYPILVSKTGFSTEKASLTIGDELKVSLSVDEVEVDSDVTISITDSLGIPVDAEITVTRPDGTTIMETSTSYTYTTKKVGEVTVQARKSGYSKSSAVLKVTTHPLEMKAFFDGDKIVINLTSREKGVSDLNVVVTLPGGSKKTVKTNNEGLASLTAEPVGKYTCEVSSDSYEKKTISVTKEKTDFKNMLIPLIIALLVLSIIIIIIIILIHIVKSKKGKGSMTRKGGSRLGDN